MNDLRRWVTVLQLPVAITAVLAFFPIYSKLILDVNLKNLRTSFTVLNGSTGVGQAEAALLLVNQTLTSQLAREETDLKTVSALQYSQGVLSSQNLQRPVDDAQAMIGTVADDQLAERPNILRTLDEMVLGVRGVFHGAVLLPRQVLGEALSPEIDSAGMERAIALEQRGLLKESAALYAQLLTNYPRYEGRAALRMRLGGVYQKLGKTDEARQEYRQAAGQARNATDIMVAQELMNRFEKSVSGQKELDRLEKNLGGLPAGLDRQQAAFQLGLKLIQSSRLDKAAPILELAYQSAPEGASAEQSLYKAGWCFRSLGRIEEAVRCFQALIKHGRSESWKVAAYYQLAELYKSCGDLATAAALYEKALSKTKADAALRSIGTVQVASLYLYDIKDPEKARYYFREAESHFPASSFSGTLKRIQEYQRGKGGSTDWSIPGTTGRKPEPADIDKQPDLSASETMAMETGSPLMKWMTEFLPVFVTVFADRLAKYMEAAGETRITRRFTELEFQDLVVREAQRRFSGQISDIQTKIKPEGFLGKGTVRIGLLRFDLEARIGIEVVDYRVHPKLREVKIGPVPIPQGILKHLETQVIAAIEKKRYPLRVKEYTLKDGYANISVEKAVVDSNQTVLSETG